MHVFAIVTAIVNFAYHTAAAPALSPTNSRPPCIAPQASTPKLQTFTFPRPERDATSSSSSQYDPEPRHIWIELFDSDKCAPEGGKASQVTSILTWASGHWYCYQLAFGHSVKFYGDYSDAGCESFVHAPAETCDGPEENDVTALLHAQQCMVFAEHTAYTLMTRCPAP